jgi:hypothetical protein
MGFATAQPILRATGHCRGDPCGRPHGAGTRPAPIDCTIAHCFIAIAAMKIILDTVPVMS